MDKFKSDEIKQFSHCNEQGYSLIQVSIGVVMVVFGYQSL